MRAARSNLHDYITNPAVATHVDNGIARLLLWPHDLIPGDDFIDPAHDDEIFEAALAMLDTFAYVGIVEDRYFVSDLGEWLGRPLSLHRLNGVSVRRQPDQLNMLAEVSGAGADLLRWRTRIDARLWRHLAARKFANAQVDEIAERTFQQAVERYAVEVAKPVKRPFRQRLLERPLTLAARLQARGRRARAAAPRAA
jgi:hypothetical protein